MAELFSRAGHACAPVPGTSCRAELSASSPPSRADPLATTPSARTGLPGPRGPRPHAARPAPRCPGLGRPCRAATPSLASRDEGGDRVSWQAQPRAREAHAGGLGRGSRGAEVREWTARCGLASTCQQLPTGGPAGRGSALRAWAACDFTCVCGTARAHLGTGGRRAGLRVSSARPRRRSPARGGSGGRPAGDTGVPGQQQGPGVCSRVPLTCPQRCSALVGAV